MNNYKAQAGFTLLEIIVSLAILTIALSAIVTVASTRTETLIQLRERDRALIVANNIMQHYSDESQQVSVGLIDGEQENGNISWKWQVNIQTTNNDYIYRLDVKVSKDSDFNYSEASLVGFKWH